MKPLKTYVFLVLVGCAAASAQTADLELENEIYRQLIPALADSLFFDFRKFPPPPPPPPLNMSRQDSIAYKEEAVRLLKEYEERVKQVEADTTTIVLAVRDTIYNGFDTADLEKFRAYFGLSGRLQVDLDTLTEYRINLEEIEPQQKFAFKYRSEFPEGRELWRKEYDFLFSGMISFSRILFDETLSYGVLTGGYGCGRLCGHCVRVFIKLVDGTWKIEEVEMTCIA